MNNFFSQPGAAWYDATFASTLGLRVVAPVRSAGAMSVASTPTAGAVTTGPQLTLPQSFALPSSGGDLRLATSALSGAGTLTVTISVGQGTLTVYNDDAVEPGQTPDADGVLLGGVRL